MTSAEAEAIVAHFAAVDNVDYPYEFDRRQQSDYLSSADAAYEKTKKEAQAAAARNPAPAAATPPAPGAAPTATVPPGDDGRLDDALRLVTDNGFCVKCHLVGDFRPAGAAAGLAPNLAGVSERLRPDYLKKWIANPTRILPYTGMPVNFPKSQLVAQHLYKGTSEEQIDAIVDFLVNYDRVLSERTKIVDFMKTAAVAPSSSNPTGAAPAASTNSAAAAGNPTPGGSAPAAGGSTPQSPPRPTLPANPSAPSSPTPNSPTPGGSAPSGSPAPSGSGTPPPPPAGNSPDRPAE
ncbi:MAG: c-type cytochrome [Planctomycetales bacterium]|nr:c-type cytochrome [Planctomycetales bacterium]